MSGGHFDYRDYRLNDLADSLRVEIAKSRKKYEYHNYSEAFLQEMISSHDKLRELAVVLHRIDWVISGDDNEDDYHRCLSVDMAQVEFDDAAKDDEWLERYKDD